MPEGTLVNRTRYAQGFRILEESDPILSRQLSLRNPHIIRGRGEASYHHIHDCSRKRPSSKIIGFLFLAVDQENLEVWLKRYDVKYKNRWMIINSCLRNYQPY